jgi:hypothetical protein
MAGKTGQGKSKPRGTPRSDIHKALAVLPPVARAAAMEAMQNARNPRPEKLTRQRLLDIRKCLDAFMDVPAENAMFAHRVAFNRQLLQPVVVEIDNAAEPTPEYKDYDVEREALCKEFAAKDDKGVPVQTDGRYVIPTESQAAFDEKAEQVREEHAGAIATYEALLKERENLLDQEIDCPAFLPVPVQLLPAGLTPRSIEPILLLLQ